MDLRAVIFDYGMVLTGLPDEAAHKAMIRISGLPAEDFEKLYWSDRHAYDEGKLTGAGFWEKFARDGKLALSAAEIGELNEQDARMWTTQNPAMVDWQRRLKTHGVKTAILSNMGDSVLERIKREFKWIENFDVLVWSFELLMAKPDPAIYRHTLKKLGTQAEETLFIDDKHVNVEAARALGLKAVEFTNIDRLRGDLVAAGFDSGLPLP